MRWVCERVASHLAVFSMNLALLKQKCDKLQVTVFLRRFGAFLESFLIFANKYCAFLKTIRTNSPTQCITCKSL